MIMMKCSTHIHDLFSTTDGISWHFQHNEVYYALTCCQVVAYCVALQGNNTQNYMWTNIMMKMWILKKFDENVQVSERSCNTTYSKENTYPCRWMTGEKDGNRALSASTRAAVLTGGTDVVSMHAAGQPDSGRWVRQSVTGQSRSNWQQSGDGTLHHQRTWDDRKSSPTLGRCWTNRWLCSGGHCWQESLQSCCCYSCSALQSDDSWPSSFWRWRPQRWVVDRHQCRGCTTSGETVACPSLELLQPQSLLVPRHSYLFVFSVHRWHSCRTAPQLARSGSKS